MPSRCIVPKCPFKNGGVSTFQVPKDEIQKRKWEEAIPGIGKKLFKTDRVCERHFTEESVKRSYKAYDKLGNVIAEVRWNLLSDFPIIINYLNLFKKISY